VAKTVVVVVVDDAGTSPRTIADCTGIRPTAQAGGQEAERAMAAARDMAQV
jgi:hypothetical protein